MTAFPQASIQGKAFTLSGHYYTAPEIFQQETQRIFHNHWLCVGRSEQICETGDYFLAQIGEEELIILRDGQRNARAFFNICRHRGTRLCHQPQGHLLEAIQCPYHGWTYSLEGELCAARQEGISAADNALFACALYEWEGCLWVNLAPNPAPFTQTISPLLHQFAPWRLASLRVGQQAIYDVQANWKLIFQTYFDRYHRRTSAARSTSLSAGAFLGAYQPLEYSSLMARSPRSLLPGVRGENCFRAFYCSLFPTMLLSLHPDYAVVHRIYPQRANHTRIVCEWLFDRSAIDSLETCNDAIDRWSQQNLKTWRDCEQMQQLVQSELSPRQAALTAFDQEYLRVLGKPFM